MHFKGAGPVLFALLAMVFIVGTYAADYKTFLRQHYDNPKSNVGKRYCDTMMKRRGMTKPMCKAVNSFVHASKKQIIAVCGKDGKPYGNGLRRSKKQFSVTTCKHQGGSTRPPCKYKENKSNRYIVVRCSRGKPVHLDKTQI
ncbi:angiogenin-2 [Anolis carolinensis]|uniref:Ribonuclease A-domain domain-containing protein n=1 Tax=Anolis carolinensis TaxID=28377 RepID=H9GQ21_ANOCA|nr:PREDICTED: angiogenin-2-like [Anolis carolinensis]|eukprot:XP_003223927.3 PREDICTED: angiogenin-2-like [Anolis carolinensis]